MAISKMRAGRWAWPLVVGVGLLVTAALAWATRTPEAFGSTGECWTLAPVPGPEDLVLVPGGRAALVSSQDRRADPKPPGAIWYVPLDPASAERPRSLPLRGRDGCSFHPHGIDLRTTREGTSLLYVINHHEPADLTSARACFDAVGRTEPRASVTSVEVFEYRGGELYFLQRLADPGVLAAGNDLVAEDDGDLWVTAPPRSPLGFLADQVGAGLSELAYFECRSADDDARCTGTWHDVELPFEKAPRYANGIEFVPGADLDRLYLASTGDGRILVAGIERGAYGAGPSLRALGFHCVEGMPDNLSWSPDGELLVAAHAHPRRYLQHDRSAATPSPWRVYALSPTGDRDASACAQRELPDPALQDAGGRLSAVSVAFAVDDDYVLGQVYGPGVGRCRPDRPAARMGATR